MNENITSVNELMKNRTRSPSEEYYYGKLLGIMSVDEKGNEQWYVPNHFTLLFYQVET